MARPIGVPPGSWVRTVSGPSALGQEPRLRALPAPLDPLESDERHAAILAAHPARP